MKDILINDPFGQIFILTLIPTILYVLKDHVKFGKIFNVIPLLVFAYFIPTLLSNFNIFGVDFAIIPNSSPMYSAIKTYIIPASLVLLILAVDIKGIIKLGPNAGILFLSGTVGIVIGGPISLYIWQDYLPPDIWQGMSALAGSWIGGGANFTALAEITKATETMLGSIIIVDVLAANILTGVLMYFAGKYKEIDAKMGADNSSIEELKQKVMAFQEKTAAITSTKDIMVMMSLAFGGSYLCLEIGNFLPEIGPNGQYISHSTWKYILVTAFAVGLSFTKYRNLDGVGASKIGTYLLYILIGVIGAGADVLQVFKEPYMFLMGLTWIIIHVLIMFIVMKIRKAPLFFMAVGSQANVGGAASAPIVASAFHPSLATVGVMLGVAGYVLGTYAAIICSQLLRIIGT